MTNFQIKHRYTGNTIFECEQVKGMTLRDALEMAIATRTNLGGANLRGADLYGANLYRANLREADLYGADLYGANLRGANLYRANLREADLYGADLRGADLRGANLREADLLGGANLRGADLYGADLYGANLYRANLREAYLFGADLRGANLREADLGEKGRLIGDRPFFTLGPIGSRDDYVQAWVTDKGLMIRAGCFFGSRNEFITAINNAHGDRVHGQEYRAALVLIDKHVELWAPQITGE